MKRAILENMFNELEHIPIDTIIGQKITLTQKGRHFYGLCPFHAATHLGSFVVTPDKGVWKCFLCGDDYAGNGIHFVSLYDNISYIEAAKKIAYEQGIISYKDYQSETPSYDTNRKVTSKKNTKKTQPPKQELNYAVMHNVYHLMKRESVLTDIHLSHLKSERNLNTGRIESDYFTFPSSIEERKRIIKKIRIEYPEYTDNVLIKIPGFYIDRKTGQLDFMSVKGIGILLRNEEGKICAIQIRRDTVKEGQQRYVWFSSTFAKYKNDEYIGGESSGSPRDYLFPQHLERTSLCITEGRFKSETILKYGNIACSLQGVYSWKGIHTEIAHIMKERELSGIYITFDADIFFNIGIYNQAKQMGKKLMDTFPFMKISFILWNPVHGKGIDDLNNNENIKKIKYEDYNTFTEKYDSFLLDFLAEKGFSSLQDIPNTQIKEFNEEFGAALINEMHLA